MEERILETARRVDVGLLPQAVPMLIGSRAHAEDVSTLLHKLVQEGKLVYAGGMLKLPEESSDG